MEPAIFINEYAVRKWRQKHVTFTVDTVTELTPAFQHTCLVGWYLVVDGVPVTEQEVIEEENV